MMNTEARMSEKKGEVICSLTDCTVEAKSIPVVPFTNKGENELDASCDRRRFELSQQTTSSMSSFSTSPSDDFVADFLKIVTKRRRHQHLLPARVPQTGQFCTGALALVSV
eukprot:scaffold1380_cov161-Amphora_coffeaeformis.AAC.4